MRTFIAIDMDEAIKYELNAFIEVLRKHPVNIKWVHSQGMHLTLKFLGETREDKISDIQKVLDNTTVSTGLFTLNIKGTGWFPPGKRSPRVLWVGCNENKILMSLQSKIENNLEELHFLKEKRNYHPHLTLGRVRNNQNINKLLDEFILNKDKNFGRMDVSKITFFQSILKPAGAEYKMLSEHNLK
mgnify:CR=1 FL=1